MIVVILAPNPYGYWLNVYLDQKYLRKFGRENVEA